MPPYPNPFLFSGPLASGEMIDRRAEAEAAGMATALVDLEDVLSLGGIVVRIERAYARRLKGSLRTRVDRLFSAWNIGLSLGGPGFSATLQRSPNAHVEAVLLRLLDLPRELQSAPGPAA